MDLELDNLRRELAAAESIADRERQARKAAEREREAHRAHAMSADARNDRLRACVTRALLRLDGLRNGHARVCAVHAGDPCDCGHVATWERVRTELNGVAP